jgi:hypothetical protein
MKLPYEIIKAFSFESENDLWKSIHMLIDASIEAETGSALSKENRGEDRAWHCGRTEALRDFKDILMNTRNEVLADLGRPPEGYSPSENGISK